VNNPEVFKNPGNDNTYVIFGEAKVEQDNVNQALAENLAQFKDTGLGGDADDEIPALVPTEGAKVEEVKTETDGKRSEAGSFESRLFCFVCLLVCLVLVVIIAVLLSFVCFFLSTFFLSFFLSLFLLLSYCLFVF
jgi:hypothetical protein